jgi:hypothetical protein
MTEYPPQTYVPQTTAPTVADVAPPQPDASVTDKALDAKDKALDAAQTGKQAAGEVAQTAADSAKHVAQETSKHARDLLGQTREQLTEQASAHQDSLASGLRSFSDELTEMTANVDTDGTAVELATQARDRTRSAAEWLEGRSPSEVLDEVRTLGRDHPAMFLAGALAAGVVAGRLTRGVVAVHTDSASDSPAAPVTR